MNRHLDVRPSFSPRNLHLRNLHLRNLHLRNLHLRNPRPGFTVLELIVALTLGLVLLSAIWTMFRLFLRHQEIETAQVERTQLVSSLHHLLMRDCLNLIPEGREGPQGPVAPAPSAPAPATTPQLEPPNPLLLFPGAMTEFPLPGLLPPEAAAQGASYSLPTSSLQGNQHRLELVVFSGPDDAPDPSEAETGSRRGNSETNSAAPRLPSKVIVYEFVGLSADLSATSSDSLFATAGSEPDEDPVDAAIAAVGLWRRESLSGAPTNGTQARGVPPTANNQAGRDSRFDATAVPTASPSSALLPGLNQQGNAESSGPQLFEEFAPEIIDFRIEYYDGRKWSSTWDSQRQKRLPVLLRVQLAVETRPAMRQRKLKERLEAGPDTQSAGPQDESPGAESMFGADPVEARQRSTSTRNDLMDSAWDYEFLLFVTPPPANSPTPQGNDRIPNAAAKGPASTSSGRDLTRPRTGAVQQ